MNLMDVDVLVPCCSCTYFTFDQSKHYVWTFSMRMTTPSPLIFNAAFAVSIVDAPWEAGRSVVLCRNIPMVGTEKEEEEMC